MKPMTRGAREQLAAYRRQHRMPPDVRARLLRTLMKQPATPEPGSISARPTLRQTRGLARLAMVAAPIVVVVGIAVVTWRSSVDAGPHAARGTPPAPSAVETSRVSSVEHRAGDGASSAQEIARADAVRAPGPGLSSQARARARTSRVSGRPAAPSPAANAAGSVAQAVAAHAGAHGTAAGPALIAPSSGTSSDLREVHGATQQTEASLPRAADEIPPPQPAEQPRSPHARYESSATSAAASRPPRQEAALRDSLDQEVMQLRVAREHLRSGNALRGLSAVDEHARRFPDGKLREMREAARIQALCDLQRVAEARARAADFLVRYRQSTFAVAIRRGCAGADKSSPQR